MHAILDSRSFFSFPLPFCTQKPLLRLSPQALFYSLLASAYWTLNLPSEAGYITLSFLFWQAKEGQLEYAAKNDSFAPLANVVPLDAKVFVPDFAWRPGLKICAGYNLPYDHWDLNARWTYYQGKFTNIKKVVDSGISPPDMGLIPLWSYYFFEQTATDSPRYRHASGDWNLDFNSVDLENGRSFYIERYLTMRLYTGLKGSWITQYYKVRYLFGNTITPINVRLDESFISFKNDSWGLGPLFGIDTKWRLIGGWSLIANSSLSMLYSFFSLRRDQIDNTTDLATGGLNANTLELDDRFSQLKPVIHIALGTDWGTCFGKNNPVFLGFTLGYELQYWWGQNQLRRFADDVSTAKNYNNNGDLMLQGLTASAKLEF